MAKKMLKVDNLKVDSSGKFSGKKKAKQKQQDKRVK